MLFNIYGIYLIIWKRKKTYRRGQVKKEEGEIYKLFEQEFGRLLSPMEYETIGMWFDQDKHSSALIRLALKEAVLSQKLSLRYIDRILFEWKKKI